jgi:hypothetical protein
MWNGRSVLRAALGFLCPRGARQQGTRDATAVACCQLPTAEGGRGQAVGKRHLLATRTDRREPIGFLPAE